MQRKWKPGDLVVVVTVNKGLPVQPARKDRKSAKAEAWLSQIVGPSVLGPGWWNVQRITPKARMRDGVYAVPDGEIQPRKG